MESSELKKMLNEILHRLEKLERKIDRMHYEPYDRPMPPYVPPFDEEDDGRDVGGQQGVMDYWRCKVCGIAIDTKTVEKNDGICVVCYE